jgi:hypothetical protein
MTFVIEYGSGKRGDYDQTSDRDVLLLGERWTEVEGLYAQFKAADYSVSFFSTGQAKYLLSEGSLFFKHVVDEGQVILGGAGNFESFAAGWKPAQSYESEIQSTVDLLDLLGMVPSCRRGIAVAMDLLVSCLRSILIRRLAERGSYIFSWAKLIREASRCGLLPPDVGGVVLYGRQVKNNYRRFGRANAELSQVQQLIHITRAAVGSARAIPSVRFSNRAGISKIAENLRDYSYKQLRAWEFLCAECPRDPSLAQFERWARQPNYFCSMPAFQRSRTHNLLY